MILTAIQQSSLKYGCVVINQKTQSPAELKTFVENITDVVISYIESVQNKRLQI